MSHSWKRAWYAAPAVWCVLAGCNSDAVVVGSAARISVVSGDAQQADAGQIAGTPVRFEVVDNNGQPVPNVPVTFAVTIGGGSVPQTQKTTGADGIVETAWTMGPHGGVQLLEARVDRISNAIASAATCAPGECYPESRLAGPLSDASLLRLATYESSGQAVHPDVAHGHGALNGFWLAITPYPGGDPLYENPSIFHSTDTQDWAIPTGITNPLVWPHGETYYNSDPDLVFNPTDQRLWMFYRGVGANNIISVIHSADGMHWDSATVVVRAPNHQVVSPTVVRGAPHAPWVMWSVNAGTRGCTATNTTVERRTSTDGLNWSAPTKTDLVQPGQLIWHIDVEWVPARAEYWAVYNTYPSTGSCTTAELYIARSSDGLHWSVSPSPIARAGVVDAFRDIVYRASFLFDSKGNRVTLWISGASFTNQTYNWQSATVSTTPATLLAIANAPNTATRATPSAKHLPPPERDVGP